ncbi:hypothetical protein AMTRI_Chr08g166340 [Amborella trichopoda]
MNCLEYYAQTNFDAFETEYRPSYYFSEHGMDMSFLINNYREYSDSTMEDSCDTSTKYISGLSSDNHGFLQSIAVPLNRHEFSESAMEDSFNSPTAYPSNQYSNGYLENQYNDNHVFQSFITPFPDYPNSPIEIGYPESNTNFSETEISGSGLSESGKVSSISLLKTSEVSSNGFSQSGEFSDRVFLNTTENSNNGLSESNKIQVFPDSEKQMILPWEAEEEAQDLQLSLLHLLKALGEAMEKGSRDLADVIISRIAEKVSPVGSTMERVCFNMVRTLEPTWAQKQTDYLVREAQKNYMVALRAFYEIFPYGRFAHFAANQAIIESIPQWAERVHIVDFDIGDGLQWPPLLQGLAHSSKVRAVHITAVRTEGERFRETKRRLCEWAEAVRVQLCVEETSMVEVKELFMEERAGEWVVVNYMVGLPHMGSRRALEKAHGLLQACGHVGLVTMGRGCVGEGGFDGCLLGLHGLLESMEWQLPKQGLARTVFESLFFGNIGPIRPESDFEFSGLIGVGLSEGSVVEARELVRACEGSYGVEVVGERRNEMVLKWRGTPLVRVSAWR